MGFELDRQLWATGQHNTQYWTVRLVVEPERMSCLVFSTPSNRRNHSIVVIEINISKIDPMIARIAVTCRVVWGSKNMAWVAMAVIEWQPCKSTRFSSIVSLYENHSPTTPIVWALRNRQIRLIIILLGGMSYAISIICRSILEHDGSTRKLPSVTIIMCTNCLLSKES